LEKAAGDLGAPSFLISYYKSLLIIKTKERSDDGLASN
jgi:hypothetical protein